MGNAAGLGTGPVTFEEGSLAMAGHTAANGSSCGTLQNELVIPTGQTGALFATQRGGLSGPWTGGGMLNLGVMFVRADFTGDTSNCTGRVNVTTAEGAEFRLATSCAPAGFPQAAVHLGAKVTMKHTGILAEGAGTSLPVGELGGLAGP